MRGALLLSVLLVACQSSSERAAGDSAYHRDIDRLCHAAEHSGANELEQGARALHIAEWLATNLESDKARGLSAELSQMPNDERIPRLAREAEAAGVEACAILEAWGGAPTGSGAHEPH